MSEQPDTEAALRRAIVEHATATGVPVDLIVHWHVVAEVMGDDESEPWLKVMGSEQTSPWMVLVRWTPRNGRFGSGTG